MLTRSGVCRLAGWLAHSLAFVFLLTPLSPRQRDFSVVTAPGAGANASSFGSLLVADRHRLEDHGYSKQTGTSHTLFGSPVQVTCSGFAARAEAIVLGHPYHSGLVTCLVPALLEGSRWVKAWGCLLQPAW